MTETTPTVKTAAKEAGTVLPDGRIVISETLQPWNEKLDPYSGAPAGTRTRTAETWTLNPTTGRITLKTSTQTRGTNRRTGNTYSSWKADSINSWRVTKAGTWHHVNGYRRGRGTRLEWASRTACLEDITPPVGVVAVILDHLPAPKSINDAYPLLHHWSPEPGPDAGSRERLQYLHARNNLDPAFLNAFTHATTLAELVAAIFGKTRTRRDLIKATAGASLAAIQTAWQFRGLVPIDWIVNYLRTHTETVQTGRYGNLRPHLRAVTHETRRRLLNDARPDWPQLLRDVARGPAVEGRFRDWSDLHNAQNTVLQQQRMKNIRVKKLPDNAAAINGSTQAGLELVMATRPAQLTEWGAVMNNCISGYTHHLETGHGWLGAVTTPTGEVLGNFEISASNKSEPWLVQLLGRFNKPLDEDIVVDVCRRLHHHGVNIGSDFWGAPASTDWRSDATSGTELATAA